MDRIDGRVLRTPAARVLLHIYLSLGGVFYENTTLSSWRLKSGLALVKSAPVLHGLLCVVYFAEHFVMGEVRLKSWKIMCWYALMPTTALLNFLVDLYVYCLRNTFKNSIKAVEDDFGLPWSVSAQNDAPPQYRKFDLRKWSFLVCFVVGLGLVVDLSFWPATFLAEIGKFNETDNITVPGDLLPKFYQLPVPYILDERITIGKFILGHSISCFMHVYCVCIIFALYMFGFVIVCSMYNSVVSLANVIDHQLRDLCSRIEESHDSYAGRKDSPLQLECLMRCTEYVGYHKSFRKHIQDIRSFIQINYSIVMMQTFLCNLPWTCMILLDKHLTIWSRISYSAGLVFLPVFLYLICFCGKVCEEMCELMLLEAYNVPWYHLTPSQRRHVLQILCFFQEPINFRGLKIYVLCMSSWARIMQTCYSITGTIRAIDSCST